MSVKPMVVIGAGLSGLCCARLLLKHKISCVLLEASDEIGGRVRTGNVDGFLLDREFQVLRTAYPEAASQLDYRGDYAETASIQGVMVSGQKTGQDVLADVLRTV